MTCFRNWGLIKRPRGSNSTFFLVDFCMLKPLEQISFTVLSHNDRMIQNKDEEKELWRRVLVAAGSMSE